jgi:phosphatidylserine decarboxylase
MLESRSDPDTTPTMGARLFVWMQYLLPQHALSRLAWHITRSRNVLVKNFLIGRFISGFRPDMSDAEDPEPLRYGSFNDFFTRALRPGARPIEADPRLIVSPVDGTVSAIGAIHGSQLMQAKGRSFSVAALLASSPARSERFVNGVFATIYLAPYNYHRIHMPSAGSLSAAWYVPGRLFSVNTATAASVSGLFARNERIVCLFEDGPLCFAVVLVGALFVGSMTTRWHGDVTPASARRARELKTPPTLDSRLEKGAELGRFNMGSTVILLLPQGAADWVGGLAAGSLVRVGQPLAQRRAP